MATSRALGYLDFTLGALPYHLLERPEVLILGAGGGTDVLLALSEGAAAIDAVELDPNLVALVRETFADFAGHLYQRPEVTVHIAEARGFVAASRQRYDLIQLPLLDSFAAAGAGTASLHESFVYTVEAVADYLDHLAPGGYLAITRWLKLPPRDSLKLFLTALVALEEAGVSEPSRRLALLRSWDATLLLVKNGPLTESDLKRIREFAAARSFDLAYLPGMRAAEANRYNVLDRPYFFEGATALIGPDRQRFLDRYKFSLAPATDERPYFFDFFRWRALPELWRVALTSGAGLLDWGYLILIATLAQAALLSLFLILLPLWLGRKQRPLPTPAAGASWSISARSALPSCSSRSPRSSASRCSSATRSTRSAWCSRAFWRSPVSAAATPPLWPAGPRRRCGSPCSRSARSRSSMCSVCRLCSGR